MPALDHNDKDCKALGQMNAFPLKVGGNIELYRFREAFDRLMNLARLGNKYLTDNEPPECSKPIPKGENHLAVSLQIVAMALL